MATLPASAADSHASPFAERWIDGTDEKEPQVQVQRYDADTFVLRQSIRTNFEGPYLYLLFGTDRALLLDSGAGGLEIRPHVDAVIQRWLREHKRASISLVVAHSHSHRDHIAGDAEFRQRPDTTVVGLKPEEIAAFFGIQQWPEQIASFDLGGRTLSTIPTPGHEPSHIMIFDERTRLLLSGDALYAGRLYFPAAKLDEFRASTDRVVQFTQSRNVAWILGAHIEMKQTPGEDYAMGAANHPAEHVLELPFVTLITLQKSLLEMSREPKRQVHEDFIIYPRP
jgi:glyoxylase-like metal-dependent hydrolase (beta-lactamase superfamily II)